MVSKTRCCGSGELVDISVGDRCVEGFACFGEHYAFTPGNAFVVFRDLHECNISGAFFVDGDVREESFLDVFREKYAQKLLA